MSDVSSRRFLGDHLVHEVSNEWSTYKRPDELEDPQMQVDDDVEIVDMSDGTKEMIHESMQNAYTFFQNNPKSIAFDVVSPLKNYFTPPKEYRRKSTAPSVPK